MKQPGWDYAAESGSFEVVDMDLVFRNVREAHAALILNLPEGWSLLSAPVGILQRQRGRYGIVAFVRTTNADGNYIFRKLVVHSDSAFPLWVDFDIRNGYTGSTTFGVLDLDSPWAALERMDEELNRAILLATR